MSESRHICVILSKKRGGVFHLEEKIIGTDNLETSSSWTIDRNFPKDLNWDSKVFIKSEGLVRGYFTIDHIDRSKGMIVFDKYAPVKPFKIKNFQSGFRYTDKIENFKYEEENIDINEYIAQLKKKHQ